MKKYLFLLALGMVVIACSESEKDTEPESKEVAKEATDETPVETKQEGGDTTLLIKSASIHSSNYDVYKLSGGNVEVWLAEEKVDAGTYHFDESTIVMDLESQTNPVEYQWQMDEDSSVNLKQLGTTQSIYAQLIVN